MDLLSIIPVSGGVQSTLFIIGLIATVIFVVQCVMMFFGGHDSDVSHDIGGHGGHGGGGHDVNGEHHTFDSSEFLTVKNVINFLMVFAWTGLALWGLFSVFVVILLAILAGLMMVFVMTMLYVGMRKLEYKSESTFLNLVGVNGTCYLKIPKNSKGKINIIHNGALTTLDANNDSDEDIQTGSAIIVSRVIDHEIYVKNSK